MVREAVRRLTDPPDALRRGPLRQGAFKSKLHDERVASWLGLALGVSFSLCFATGLLSHFIQHPPSFFTWPSRPAGLYRVTQGLHVTTGLASIPLLLAKLWSVYPHLWTWPPVRNAAHLVERISLLPLVGGSLFLLFSGLANISLWYPWRFFFPAGHYSAAWITIGALVVHVGAKWAVIRASLARGDASAGPDALERRRFLRMVAGLSGMVAVTTVGQTFRPLRDLALLAPRRPDVGPQGFPVNKTALGAGVVDPALSPEYRLIVDGNVERKLSLSLEQLRALPQREATLPIACVEGWSASKTWRGIPVRELLDLAGAPADAEVEVVSLQERGLYKASILARAHSSDEDSLLAMFVEGEELHLDHGYPVRLIAPNRPGVMQTKWVTRLTVA
ncbi:MAG TPA: molybdopterin-dependent oxidoreductase [Actinomycetota bacterium]|nr:molybdopterin-dependent oxidoreductase [Actinomycetota bacterium]